MSRNLTASDMLELETMLDRSSLTDVLHLLASICEGKAEHLRSNWQDTETAKLYYRAVHLLDMVAQHASIVEVSL